MRQAGRRDRTTSARGEHRLSERVWASTNRVCSALIRASFDMLGLITFLTTGRWKRALGPLPRHNGCEGAGKIHTDIQKGFIRAEVVSYEDMVKYHGRVGAKEAGKVTL